jgi:hypothetical protein
VSYFKLLTFAITKISGLLKSQAGKHILNFFMICWCLLPVVYSTRTSTVTEANDMLQFSGFESGQRGQETGYRKQRAGTLAAENFIGNRVVGGTRYGYEGKLCTTTIYLMERGLHQYVNDGDRSIPVHVPLPFDLVKDIFGWLGTNTDIPQRHNK